MQHFLLRVLAITLSALCMVPVAMSQDRGSKGDLVEFVSGLGPMIGEVIDGPDPSNFYMVRIPGKDALPINGNKLRLVQRAGTPNAALKVGEAVGWSSGGVVERGTVVKVNGAWCEVKSLDATVLGWLECNSLRTAQSKPQAPAAASTDGGVALPKNLLGEWENADGTFKLELKAGGKCYLSMGPATDKCTYKTSANQLTLRMAGEDMPLTADEDGALNGPPDSMIPMRFKKKK